jgi:hypothetical protein
VSAGDGAAPLEQLLNRLGLSIFEFQLLIERFRRFEKCDFVVDFGLVMTKNTNEKLSRWCDAIATSVIDGVCKNSTEQLRSLHPEIPIWAIDHLIQSDTITLGLTRGEKLTHILNRNSRPLGINEIAHEFIAIFGDEHSPGTISNLAIETKEIALADRGTYSTYRRLDLDDHVLIERIRALVLKVLKETDSTVSTEHLYNILKVDKRLPKQIANHYILHSLLRDDDRFRVFPGLTVQASVQNPDQHQTLDERIWSIVASFGPVSVNDVFEKLKENGRYTLTVNIVSRLSQSPLFVKIGDGSYDLTERVVGNPVTLKDFEIACKICLAEYPKTARRVSEEITKLPDLFAERLSPIVFDSLLSKLDGVGTDGSLFRLEQDHESNRSYFEYLAEHRNLPSTLLEAYSKFDWRCHNDSSNGPNETPKLDVIDFLLDGM